MTCPDRSGSVGVDLEFLPEPTLIVNLNGEVRRTNSAARRVLGAGDALADFLDLAQDRGEAVELLRRASRSTAPHVGSITLRRAGEFERFRALAARLRCADRPETLLVVRLTPSREDHFSVLNRRLLEVNRQLHERLKENALLQESLAENRVLVRELQHRVKNNIQRMLSLIRVSADKRRAPEVEALVQTASQRLQALAATQEALFRSGKADAVSARGFLEDVVRSAASSCGASQTPLVSVADATLTSEEAHCLALIANELVTNACKHGVTRSSGAPRVSLSASADGLRLDVCDNGPGFKDADSGRSSGLMLVRALCRQIGGRLEIVNDGGARCSVHFRSELPLREHHETACECG